MEETYSKSRQQAEIAFGAAQSQFFARGHAVEELESIVTMRDDKTIRLRAARLAKELADRTAEVIATPVKKRTQGL